MNTQQIFKDNIGLAYILAGKYQGSASSRGIHFDDITQASLIALWDCIPRWDASRSALSTFFYRHGHRALQRFINSPEHFDAFHTKKKPSGNSYQYIRTPATVSYGASRLDPDSDASLTRGAERGLDAAVLKSNIEVLQHFGWYTPPDAPERSVLAAEAYEVLLASDWPINATACLLGSIEGYSCEQLAEELSTTRMTANNNINRTLNMLRMRMVG